MWCSLVFPIIGLIAIPFPQLFGNGKGMAQSGFDNEVGLALAAITTAAQGRRFSSLAPGRCKGGGSRRARASAHCILGSFSNHPLPTQPLAGFAIIAVPRVVHENASYGYHAHSRTHRYRLKVPNSTFACCRWFHIDLPPLW